MIENILVLLAVVVMLVIIFPGENSRLHNIRKYNESKRKK